jgi:hypothetical protein
LHDYLQASTKACNALQSFTAVVMVGPDGLSRTVPASATASRATTSSLLREEAPSLPLGIHKRRVLLAGSYLCPRNIHVLLMVLVLVGGVVVLFG